MPSVDRYQPVRLLGEGSSGQVWLAHDRVTGDRVALKRVGALTATDRERVRREALALRVLRAPGVVAVRDEGVDEGGPFLVMEVVDGRPFPGAAAPLPWSALRPLLARLLGTLAVVHAAGLVHRDLKPTNVLVTSAGEPVVLDFGIARGPVLGDTITHRDHVLGTPRYLAPEALFSARVDARADLYAVGVMAWEALVGAGPYADELPLGAKLVAPPPLAAHRLAGLSPDQAAFVDALVAPDPAARPSSAVEALERLWDDDPAPELPLLGRDADLDAVVARLADGRATRVLAGPGSGATRFLEALARRVGPDRVVRPVPGTRPFSSLTAVVGEPGAGADLAEVRDHLARAVAGGFVVLIDRGTAMDRWSAEWVASAGRVVRVVDVPPADVELLPLSVGDLRGLLSGPERLVRAPSRAAALLWEHTQGVPALVDRELRSWVRRGHARRTGDRFEVGARTLDAVADAWVAAFPRGEGARDPQLDRLLALVWLARPDATLERLHAAAGRPRWEVEAMMEELRRQGLAAAGAEGFVPRAPSNALREADPGEVAGLHASLADTHPEGSVARARHLVLAGKGARVALEAARLAHAASEAGAATTALTILAAISTAELDESRSEDVLVAWATLALEQRTPDTLDRALRALRGGRSPAVGAWTALLEAWRHHEAGRRAEASAAAAALPTEGLGSRYLRWLATLEMELAKDRPAEAAAVVRRYQGEAALGPTVAHWRGLHAYREGRFRDAAVLHEGWLERTTAPVSRCSALGNAAAAWLEVPDLERATLRGRELLAEARAAGLLRFEARAEWILRSAASRSGAALEPDLELVEAAASLGLPTVCALLQLTEAAIAWRAGAAVAAELADRAARAARSAGQGSAALLAGALAAAIGGDRAELAEAARRAASCPLPGIALQVVGLARGAATDEHRRHAARLASGFPREHWPLRREVLSIEECLRDG